MRVFLRSIVPYAVVTIVYGVLALLPAAVIGIDALQGLDAFASLMLLAALPLAIGGGLAVTGGALVLRRKASGRVVATVGLAIGALHPLVMGGLELTKIGACGPLPRDCAYQWFGVIVLFGGAGIIGYLIAALWVLRIARKRKRA